MEDDFTFDSMLKEIKKNLAKFESIIKEIESYPSKKKLTEADTIQKKIVQKIKMVKSITKTEEDNFMLDSYIELNTELNNRLIISKKRQEKNSQKKNYKEFLNTDKNKIKNIENINALDDEHESLKNCIKLSTEITQGLKNTNEELENQSKRLDESNEMVVKTLQKMPIIGKMMGDIKYYQIREKLIIGCVVGVVIFIMLFITFHRRK
jgi:hypothetical protein